MEPRYNPEGVEERWQRDVGGRGALPGRPDDPRPTYVDAHPPPNVTGELHIGHAMGLTLADALIRWKRMQGYNCLFQPGYDHAGISTQAVVEKELEREGKTRQELGREAFVELVWDWLHRYGRTIMTQFRRLGASMDYRARADDDGRALPARGDAPLRPPVGARLALPRQPDRQLVPVPHLGALRPGARPGRGGRRARLRALSVRRRRGLTSRSRPCGRRRSSRTSPSPCTPRTSVTASSSGARWSCRSSSGACR